MPLVLSGTAGALRLTSTPASAGALPPSPPEPVLLVNESGEPLGTEQNDTLLAEAA